MCNWNLKSDNRKGRNAGRFTDNSGEQIKRILLYGEDANAVFYALPEKSQAVNEEKKYWFRLYENVKGNDILRMSKNEFSADSGGSIKIPLNTKGDGIKENEHPAATSDEDVEKELDEELDGFFAKDNRYNYYLQLKIAKETTLNKSIGQAAVKIGVPWERKEKEYKECVCKKYNLVWSGKVTCEFRKKVVQICTELWGEDRKIEMANGLMAVMNAETRGSFKAQQVEGWKSVKTPSEMTIADFRINGAQCSSRAVGLIQFTQVALEALGEYVSNKALTKEQKFDELNKVKLRFVQMGEIKQTAYPLTKGDKQ